MLTGWDFTQATDSLGWAPIHPLPAFGVKNGALVFPATTAASILYGPAISIATAPLQRVEIRMKSDTAGPARVFWAPTPNGAAGFIGGDENDFVLVADAAFHDYVLPISTSSAQTIFGLRLDVPAGATVSIQSVALASLTEPSGAGDSPIWEFDKDGDQQGWILYQGVADITASGGRLKVHTYTNSILLAPRSHITPDREWVSLYGRVTDSALDTPWFDLNWVSRGAPATLSFPMASDPADHVYNENVGGFGGWFANVSQFAIALPGEEQVEFDWIRISGSPQTPADLVVDACAPVDAPVRAGSSFQFSCRISNRGAQSSAITALALSGPGDAVQTVASPNAPGPVVEGYAQTVTWTLQALQSGTFPVSVTAQAQAGNPAPYSTTILIHPAVDKQASPYVPAPHPAASNYDVGVFMYPGWSRYSNWDYIRSFPERMPMLGYYRDGDPRVIDWQIKWAAEHGIKFFASDWYRVSGGDPQDYFLQGFLSSKYRGLMKFCISWADDSPTNTPRNTAEFLDIVNTWIDKYFLRGEYYTISNSPVVIVLGPDVLRNALGGSVKPALDAARQMARAAGLNGIYFIGGGVSLTSQLTQLAADGYDASTIYDYSSYSPSAQNRAPYSALVDADATIWDTLLNAKTLPYVIPTSTGFDGRPWTADSLVRTGSSAGEFQRMLQMAKDRIDAGKAPKTLMVCCWNEIAEGHFIEPTSGNGFTYLDAVRNIFVGNTPHVDLAPTDVQLPPVLALRTANFWTFTSPDDLIPWGNQSGPPYQGGPQGISNSRIAAGQWAFTSDGKSDMSRFEFEADTRDYSNIVIRMKTSQDAVVGVFWGAADSPGPSALRTIVFTAKAGPLQTYTLNVAANPSWRGVVNQFRITISSIPSTAPADIAIESIQFMPAKSTAILSLSQQSLDFSWTAGTPAPAAKTIVIASGSNTGLSWSTSADGAWLSLSPPTGTTTGNLLVSVNPQGLAPGVYTATVTITAAGTSSGTLKVPVALWVTPAALGAKIAAVTNAASNKGGVIAPGEIVTIYGTGLGSDPLTSFSLNSSGRIPTLLAGTQVLFNGTPGPLLYTSSGQVAAIVPYATARDSVVVQVVYGDVVSSPFPVALGPSAPAFFTADSSGSGRAAALNQDFTPNSPQNPAHLGGVVTFYATGEGVTQPAGVDGQPAALPLPAPVLPVKVTIGGQPAIVQYAGAAPGLVEGVLQVNAVIPLGIVPGDAVPVTMTVGGTATQAGISIAAVQ